MPRSWFPDEVNACSENYLTKSSKLTKSSGTRQNLVLRIFFCYACSIVCSAFLAIWKSTWTSWWRPSEVPFSAGLRTTGRSTPLHCFVTMPELYSFDEQQQTVRYYWLHGKVLRRGANLKNNQRSHHFCPERMIQCTAWLREKLNFLATNDTPKFWSTKVGLTHNCGRTSK